MIFRFDVIWIKETGISDVKYLSEHEGNAMRLTTRTNLAARALMFCAVNDEQLVRTSDIAERCNASSNHVARVVQKLQAEGYLETLRGRTGGIRLAKPANGISIGAVFRIFETDIPFAECFDADRNTCPCPGPAACAVMSCERSKRFITSWTCNAGRPRARQLRVDGLARDAPGPFWILFGPHYVGLMGLFPTAKIGKSPSR